MYIYNTFSFAKLKMCKYENNCFYFTTLKFQFPYIVEKRKDSVLNSEHVTYRSIFLFYRVKMFSELKTYLPVIIPCQGIA